MKICVLIKQVPDKNSSLTIAEDQRSLEENNITWGRKFEEKGANVIYSYPKIKVHSKIFLK